MANLAEMFFRRADQASQQEFSFDSDMLKLFMAIDGQKTIQDVYLELRLNQTRFKTALAKLIKLGLIEQTEKEEQYVEESFLNHMRSTLITLIGPLGEVLIPDVAENMGCQTNRIPVSRLADFVAAVAREIPGGKQSSEFENRMLIEMKTMVLEKKF